MILPTRQPQVPTRQITAGTDHEPQMLLKTIASVTDVGRLGSHAGSHTDGQPWDAPDRREQRGEISRRSRTVLNGAGRPRGHLRIRRLGVRVPPSAPSSAAGSELGAGLSHAEPGNYHLPHTVTWVTGTAGTMRRCAGYRRHTFTSCRSQPA